jgi:hypothetical protein
MDGYISELNGDEYTSQRLKCNWRQVTLWIDGCYIDYSDVLCVLVYYWTFQLKVGWFVLFYEVHCICYFTFVKEVKDLHLVKRNLVWFSVYNNLFFLLSNSNGKIATSSWITPFTLTFYPVGEFYNTTQQMNLTQPRTSFLFFFYDINRLLAVHLL